ncbi:E3 ubiquitin-protein ligase RNF8 [Amphibalanus amphitrite]|uniref:E3 ubiquitin-protein ligase RNF8 n=1 Tax=Amphibalanus amphitrite TaxID=1232801 RepID=A0A6A4VSF9_AMPAM|nr:E3 ubiquitin-protein ligase RNF8 [Amphibalanus amphitrite]
MGTCDKKGQCLKEHNIFKGEQNKEILKKFNLLGAKDVFATIREGYEARAAAKKAAAVECPEGATGGAAPPSAPQRAGAGAPVSLTCAVCCEPFVRATTLGCTHTFCEGCVRDVQRQRQPCPLCRAPIATAVRSLVIDDTVAEWFDGQDEETRRARRQLEAERRRAATVPQPLMAAKAEPPSRPGRKPAADQNKPPGNKKPPQRHRAQSKGRGAKTVVTTTVTYH